MTLLSFNTDEHFLSHVGQCRRHVQQTPGQHDRLGRPRLPLHAQPGSRGHRAWVHLSLLRTSREHIFISLALVWIAALFIRFGKQTFISLTPRLPSYMYVYVAFYSNVRFVVLALFSCYIALPYWILSHNSTVCCCWTWKGIIQAGSKIHIISKLVLNHWKNDWNVSMVAQSAKLLVC